MAIPTPLAGVKADDRKARWDLLPWFGASVVVDVLTVGAKKYAPHNWRSVPGWRWRYHAAAMRHLAAWSRGEVVDRETGIHHLAHAVCCLLFIIELEILGSVVDPDAEDVTTSPEVGPLPPGPAPAPSVATLGPAPAPSVATLGVDPGAALRELARRMGLPDSASFPEFRAAIDDHYPTLVKAAAETEKARGERDRAGRERDRALRILHAMQNNGGPWGWCVCTVPQCSSSDGDLAGLKCNRCLLWVRDPVLYANWLNDKPAPSSEVL